jgi:hypothetical protein
MWKFMPGFETVVTSTSMQQYKKLFEYINVGCSHSSFSFFEESNIFNFDHIYIKNY